MASLIFGFRHNLGRIFVDDPDVVALVKQVAWLAAVYQIPDCFFGVISGILRWLPCSTSSHFDSSTQCIVGKLLGGGCVLAEAPAYSYQGDRSRS